MDRCIKTICAIALLLQAACVAGACTDFQIKAEDGTVIIASANEYAMDAHSQIMFEPALKRFTTNAPEGKKGISCES
ncbi:MAG: hypothetical protein Q8N91_05020 [Candidatus Omnitrophota bacterium]|nr:hypothetical protein [Candidatus Omnitrophota bacterium]